jgi:DNA-binding CsgD family transcriptional regulator
MGFMSIDLLLRCSGTLPESCSPLFYNAAARWLQSIAIRAKRGGCRHVRAQRNGELVISEKAKRIVSTLTWREEEVLVPLVLELRDKETAQVIGISESAVKTRLLQLRRKFGVRSRREIVRRLLLEASKMSETL